MKFVDRKTNSNKLLMILAGYKPELYNVVFDRLVESGIEGMDVCIISSGIYDEELERIAEKNQFSYFYSSLNNICWCENKVIELFDKAEYIFKMDEDMFVTKDCFRNMLFEFIRISNNSEYVPSSIVPLINVNCTTYREILKRVGKLKEFEEKFGKAKITNGLHHNRHILENPEVAQFIWENVDIDRYAATCCSEEYSVCATRFSIGLILFTRKTWEMMGHFTTEFNAEEDYRRKGLGTDEKDICRFSMMKAMPMIITKSTIVGHLGYGPQTGKMLKFFEENENIFAKPIYI